MEYDGIQKTDLKESLVMNNAVWNASLTLLIFSTVILIYSRAAVDPDLWGHLRFGLDVLETGKLARVDPYSFITAGTPWINHEWLAEVLMGLAWTAGGATGLILLRLSIAIFTMGIVYGHLRATGFQPLRAGVLILFVTLVAWFSFITVRPLMFTNLFFALTVWVVYRAEHGQYKFLWILPACFALWANLHGGFLAGIGLVCLWALLHLLFDIRSLKQIILPFAAILAAPILNPYGIKLLIFLLETATVPRPEITEWSPLMIVSFTGILYMLLLFICFLALLYSRRERRISLVILFFGMAILPFMAVRHTVLSSVAIVILNGPHLFDLLERARPQRMSFQDPAGRHILVTISIIITLVALAVSSTYWKQIGVGENDYPVGATAILKASGVSGNLANTFNSGEYLIWHLGPQIKVMIDGRRETVYPEEIYQKTVYYASGKGDWEELLDQHNLEMALVERSRAIYNLLLLKPDWVLVYQDEHSGLFVKDGSRYLAPLAKAAAGYRPPTGPFFFPSKR